FAFHQGVPLRIGQRRVQLVGGGAVGLLQQGAVLGRALHPQHRIEVVVGRNGGAGRRGGRGIGPHGLAGGKRQHEHGGADRGRAHGTVSQRQTRILAARRAGSCRRQAQQQVGRTHVHAQLVEQGGGLAAVVGLVVEEVQQQVRQ